MCHKNNNNNIRYENTIYIKIHTMYIMKRFHSSFSSEHVDRCGKCMESHLVCGK